MAGTLVVLDAMILNELAFAFHCLKIGIESIVVDIGIDVTRFCTEWVARITGRRG